MICHFNGYTGGYATQAFFNSLREYIKSAAHTPEDNEEEIEGLRTKIIDLEEKLKDSEAKMGELQEKNSQLKASLSKMQEEQSRLERMLTIPQEDAVKITMHQQKEGEKKCIDKLIEYALNQPSTKNTWAEAIKMALLEEFALSTEQKEKLKKAGNKEQPAREKILQNYTNIEKNMGPVNAPMKKQEIHIGNHNNQLLEEQ